ncbi:MAG: hypothetical protein ACRC7N_03610 [Clostridium sp.]
MRVDKILFNLNVDADILSIEERSAIESVALTIVFNEYTQLDMLQMGKERWYEIVDSHIYTALRLALNKKGIEI